MAMVCDPAAPPDGTLPEDVYLNRLNLYGVCGVKSKQKKRMLDVANHDPKISAALKKKSSRTPANICAIASMQALCDRICAVPHHPLYAELQDAVEKKKGLRDFVVHVTSHPELLETVPYLPRKQGVPHMIDHPDLLETIPYILDRKKEGTPPNPELLETMLNYMAKKEQELAI
ncbi:g6120 [Coccomyxa elongata]